MGGSDDREAEEAAHIEALGRVGADGELDPQRAATNPRRPRQTGRSACRPRGFRNEHNISRSAMTAPEDHGFAVGDDGGAPKDNENAVGNSGGAPPPANQNAARHHLFADPAKVLEYLEREEPEAYQWVQAKFESYLEDAPFAAGTAKADHLRRLAVEEYAIWKARGIQIREGLVKQTHMKRADGELVEVARERPVNQPANRMDRQVMSKLKKLGVLVDSDTQAAADITGNEYYDIEVIEVEKDEDDPEAEAGGGDG